jgi:uncharacterized protein YbaP (TraB family)
MMPTFSFRALLALLILLQVQPLSADPVWRIEQDGRQLFLAGSIHLLRRSDLPLPPAFDRAFAQADRLVFETDIAATRSPSFLEAMDRALRLPEDETLSRHIAAETRALLAARLRQYGLSLQAFEAYKPAMLSISLTMLELQRLGIDAPGVDEWLYRRAQAAGKPVSGLETPQQQIDFLARMGEGEEDALLRQTLVELGTLESDFDRMIAAWRRGDLRQLESLFIAPMRDTSPRLYQTLMVRRNRAWLPRLMRLLATPPTELVVVGSAHLAGADGLIARLRQAGLRVTRLQAPATGPATAQ